MSKFFLGGILAKARSISNGDVKSGFPFILIVRITVSAGIFAFLFWWLPVDKLLSAVASVPATIWLLVVGLVIVIHAVVAIKWRLMLRITGTTITVARAIRAHGAGMFATIFLPGNVGGDFVRAADIVREKKGKLGAIAVGSLSDRVNDMLALILISFLASLFLPEIDQSIVGDALFGVAFLMFFGIVAGIGFVRFVPTERLPRNLARVVAKFSEAITSLFAFPLIGLAGFGLSISVQCAFISLNIVFAKSIGLDVPIVLWFFAWPLTKFAALAPVSLGGLGVRNVVLASLMTPFGADPSLVVAQSLCWDGVMLFSGLAGISAAMWPVRSGDHIPRDGQ